MAGIVAFCLGCTPRSATPEEFAEALSSIEYDQTVVADLPRYRALFEFVHSHLDTLIAMRDQRALVTFVNGSHDGLRDTTYAVPEECYRFFKWHPQHDLNSTPVFLRQQLDSLFNQFSSDRILSFEFCEEGRGVIEVRTYKVTDAIRADHELIWDPKQRLDRRKVDVWEFDKDTLLPTDCMYRIAVFHNYD